MNNPSYFEDLVVADRLTTARRTISETDIVSFVGLAHMIEPLFVDMEYVAEESPYGNRIAPGALTYAIAEGLILGTGQLSGTGLAFLQAEFRTPAPVFVGDTLHVEQEVVDKRMSSKGGRGIVTFSETVKNQRGETVLVREIRRMVVARNGSPPENEPRSSRPEGAT